MTALIARSVAIEELGSSMSFKQVLYAIGSSFGTAMSGAVVPANGAADQHATATGTNISLQIGAMLSLSVFLALVLNVLSTQFRSAT